MAVYDILPGVNLTGDDIRDTLNANGGNVTNDPISWFQEGANINKWAKYKPTKFTSIFPDKEIQYKGNAQLCGFTDKIWNTGVPGKLYSNGDAYIYELPIGGAKYSYRPDDFRGYNPKAMPFVYSLINNDSSVEVLHKDYNNSTQIECYITNGEYESLKITDFSGTVLNLNKIYVKCDIYRENPLNADNPNSYLVATEVMDFPIIKLTGTNGLHVFFNNMPSPAYYYMLFYLGEKDGRYCMAMPIIDGTTVLKKVLLRNSIAEDSLNITPVYLGDSYQGDWKPIGIYTYDNWLYVNRYPTYAGTRLDIALRIENLLSYPLTFGAGINFKLLVGSDEDSLTEMATAVTIETSYNPNRNYTVDAKETTILYFRFANAFKELPFSNVDAYFKIQASYGVTSYADVTDIIRIRINNT